MTHTEPDRFEYVKSWFQDLTAHVVQFMGHSVTIKSHNTPETNSGRINVALSN